MLLDDQPGVLKDVFASAALGNVLGFGLFSTAVTAVFFFFATLILVAAASAVVIRALRGSIALPVSAPPSSSEPLQPASIVISAVPVVSKSCRLCIDSMRRTQLR